MRKCLEYAGWLLVHALAFGIGWVIGGWLLDKVF